MNQPIGPGDWVECVQTSTEKPLGQQTGFRLGGLYLVDEGGVTFGHAWLNCAGMARPNCGFWRGWNAKSFRPIYRPKADFIESLKAPATTTRQPVEVG